MACDCGNQTAAQANPCDADCENTVENESLPSVVENFITHFFGTLTKTLVDGQIIWELPCDLSTGIAGNPRQSGEGLACYFKRLFEEGLSGLAGLNGFATITEEFIQPDVGFEVVAVVDSTDPFAIGQYVWAGGDGGSSIYQVKSVGTNTVTLENLYEPPFSLSSGNPITSGSKLVPAGPLSIGPKGNKGDPGQKGNKGDKGNTGATGNKFVYVFKRSATAPSAPTGDSTPAGWSATPPAPDGNVLYFSTATQTSVGVTQGSWSTPVAIAESGTSALRISTLVTNSDSVSLTLLYSAYVYEGSSEATWTLPAIAGSEQTVYIVKNRGTENINLNGPSAGTVFTSVSTDGVVIEPGECITLLNDGTYWNVITALLFPTSESF